MSEYGVFLSHNSADRPAVEELARRLVKGGIQPWLDTWNLIPGEPWQEAVEEALQHCATCAVFVGPSGTGPWQNEEMRAAIDRRVRESGGRFRAIPVLLPGDEMTQLLRTINAGRLLVLFDRGTACSLTTCSRCCAAEAGRWAMATCGSSTSSAM